MKSLGMSTEARTLLGNQLVQSVIMYLITPFFAAKYLTPTDVNNIEARFVSALHRLPLKELRDLQEFTRLRMVPHLSHRCSTKGLYRGVYITDKAALDSFSEKF